MAFHMHTGIYTALARHEQEDTALLLNAPDSIRHEFEGGMGPGPFSRDEDRLSHTEAAPCIRVAEAFCVRKHTAPIQPYFHRHRFAELLYVHKGTCRQWLESVSNPQDIAEGHFALIGPSVKHALQSPGPDDLILKFFIPLGFLSGLFTHPADPLTQVFAPPAAPAGVWLRFAPQGADRVGPLLERLLGETLLDGNYAAPACKSYLALLLIELMRSGRPRCTSLPLGPAQQIDRIIAALPTGDAFPTLEELAGRLGYHPGYLGRKIREAHGCGYRQLMHKLRLERAIGLLLNTGETVESIALRLGYESPGSLYRLIRSVYGTSPAALRKTGSIPAVK